MGAYDSHFTGQITITPPLTWPEIRSPRQPDLQDVRLVLDEKVTDTDTGRSTVVTATAIAPLEIYYYSGISIQEEIQAVIDAHKAHEFTGTIEARPEDPDGTPWRYVIRGRRVVREEPRLVWPNEDEAARPTEPPSSHHAAIYVDEDGDPWVEYLTSPRSGHVVQLVIAPEVAVERSDLEDRIGPLKLIGWCKQ